MLFIFYFYSLFFLPLTASKEERGEKKMSQKSRSNPPSQAPSSVGSSISRIHVPEDRTLVVHNLKPSEFGYHTEKPLHREARRVLHDRDKREKTRIEAGAIPSTTNPLTSQGNAAGFAHNAERFTKNIPQQLNNWELQRKQHKQDMIAKLNHDRDEREKHRWQKMDEEQKKAEREANAVAGTGLRNKGSVGYNLINGHFGSSQEAAKAKMYDDAVEYTARLRTQNLDRRANAQFNVITGVDRPRVVVPPPPRPAEALNPASIYGH